MAVVQVHAQARLPFPRLLEQVLGEPVVIVARRAGHDQGEALCVRV